jgi:mannose/fructose-specific phosphotransferase system component IIA
MNTQIQTLEKLVERLATIENATNYGLAAEQFIFLTDLYGGGLSVDDPIVHLLEQRLLEIVAEHNLYLSH